MAEDEQRVLLLVDVHTFGEPNKVGTDVEQQVARSLKVQFTQVGVMRVGPNKADWKWDEELQMHIPCCSQPFHSKSLGRTVRCGNGPLEDERLRKGDCGGH